MTAQEMITALAGKLGNRTDMNNADYIQLLNFTILDISTMFVRRVFPQRRFPQLEETIIFTTAPLTGTALSATASTLGLAAAHASLVTDYYKEFIVEITSYDEIGAGTSTPSGLVGQQRIVTGYTPGTNVCATDEDWSVTPDIYTRYTLYRKLLPIQECLGLNPSTELLAVQEIETLAGTKLEQVSWNKLTGTDWIQVGTPTQFARHGDDLVYNIAPDAETIYRVHYYRMPALLSAAALNTECALPLEWHECVILGATARGFRDLFEPDRAKEAEGNYITQANNRITAQSVVDDFVQEGLQVRFE